MWQYLILRRPSTQFPIGDSRRNSNPMELAAVLLHGLHFFFIESLSTSYTLNGSQSQWLPVTSGVPQGTVLGPLLFLIYIDDIVENLSSEIRLFADDCILYKEMRSLSDCVVMQRDIDTFHSWSLEWQMNFNAKKCQTVCITRKRTKPWLIKA